MLVLVITLSCVACFAAGLMTAGGIVIAFGGFMMAYENMR